jgi:hypothetical protein
VQTQTDIINPFVSSRWDALMLVPLSSVIYNVENHHLLLDPPVYGFPNPPTAKLDPNARTCSVLGVSVVADTPAQ